MIQIISCICTEQKLREAGAAFYTEIKKFSEIKNVFVVLCERHPMFRERFANAHVEMFCKCLLQDNGRCKNCKTKCFTLKSVVSKCKLLPKSVSISIKLKPINEYLRKDLKSMLFWHFCKNCVKVVGSLNNPEEFEFLKGKRIWGIDRFRCKYVQKFDV